MDRRKIIRRDPQSSNSTTVGDNRDSLPRDLITEILLRLPAKSIAICRCVSKQWLFLLRNLYFTELFRRRSLTQQRILLALQYGSKWQFFTCSQPHNLDGNVRVVLPDYDMDFFGDWYKEVCQSVHGLIFLMHKQIVDEKIGKVPVICNPSTGQQLFLPKPRAKNLDLRTFFMYDPIGKEYKVLCMTVANYRKQTNSKEHQILTLGKGKLLWRKLECPIPHYPEKWLNGICWICINGVLYYKAWFNHISMIACFDVRSEKFSSIESPKGSKITSTSDLMNYKGKLGVLIDGYGKARQLWVLNVTEKEKQWKQITDWPNARYEFKKAIWISDNDEIGWIPKYWTNPFCICYHNLETAIYRRVEIKGIHETFSHIQNRPYEHFLFIDHVENLMWL